VRVKVISPSGTLSRSRSQDLQGADAVFDGARWRPADPADVARGRHRVPPGARSAGRREAVRQSRFPATPITAFAAADTTTDPTSTDPSFKAGKDL
jgi:hypothetical protein